MDTSASGEIDYDQLREHLAANVARPAIINVNIGTTVKGAVDDLDRVLDILKETGYTEDRCGCAAAGGLQGWAGLGWDGMGWDGQGWGAGRGWAGLGSCLGWAGGHW